MGPSSWWIATELMRPTVCALASPSTDRVLPAAGSSPSEPSRSRRTMRRGGRPRKWTFATVSCPR
ncbi:hypothetical protein ACFPRL_26225 [Pseudoclavibacter helvolus]